MAVLTNCFADRLANLQLEFEEVKRQLEMTKKYKPRNPEFVLGLIKRGEKLKAEIAEEKRRREDD